ncbi:CRAL-TRIO domain-containing protein [Cynara cardunculus var. scolymus]|uniref:CRAL-TRIO domain-containing protein n=1 Tax=Cynara cardunculus var. scolymus TaxID=59895 RepID=A0A103XTP3_CYNCS|nr:CRAL-TRIO domain-containing protein [Cynara cardunculus var. scolymus]
MGVVSHEAINQFKVLMDQVDEPLKRTFQNVHRGYKVETLERFLKARDGVVARAHKMLVDSLHWRLQNGIDDILSGLPVFAIGVGLSTYDKASVHYYVQSHIQINEYRDRVILPAATKKYGRYIGKCVKVLDMSGLKLSALNQIKLLTAISTIDDLNYPEKTVTYYIVNVPYIFSACWKIMDYSSLPHFCRGSSRRSDDTTVDCFSFDHPFHQELYRYIKKQSGTREPTKPLKQGSVHVEVPLADPKKAELCRTLESEWKKFQSQDGLTSRVHDIKISD